MFTKEQREVWDKVQGPGLYTIDGLSAYDYLCHRIKWMLLNGPDRYTVLLIGMDHERAAFIAKMWEMGVIEKPVWEPEFFGFQDRLDPGNDEDDLPGSCHLNSEDDTEDFCNFIRNSRAKSYNRVCAVVILNEGDDFKCIDKLLKIPVLMHGETTVSGRATHLVKPQSPW